MGLALYNSDKEVLSSEDVFRAVVDGYLGGSDEQKIYIRNDDSGLWFSNIILKLRTSVYDGDGEFGTSGIGWKFIYGERRPTEAEWDLIHPGQPINLPNIGSTFAADTYTYHPIYIRVSVPGNSDADIIDGYNLVLTYLPRLVSE